MNTTDPALSAIVVLYARAQGSSLEVVSPVVVLVFVSEPSVYVIGPLSVVAVVSDPIALSFPVVDGAYMSTVHFVKVNLSACKVISI